MQAVGGHAGGERTPLLSRGEGRKRNDPEGNDRLSDLEHGDAVQAANVSFGRVLALVKPDAGKMILATIALLIAATSGILIVRMKSGFTIYHLVNSNRLLFG
ncbi:unnamed protein product [Linum tenue]|uniref:Uncharacterized protein n=1 Tax=Linum tenue TaxID=586396 RepID=A0AAV0JUX6_9ROSI|nr:unnamed protein product [Linum tenue]